MRTTTMKTITIEIPDLASDEDKILEIINGLEEIGAALDDIILDEDSEAAECMEAAVDAVSSAIESLDTTVALLDLEDVDDEDDEEEDDEEEESSGLHITIEI